MPIFRGKPTCECLAEWLPWFERVLLAKGIIRHSIDIYQLTGGAKASAGTHSEGGAFDLAQFSTPALRVARDMGADADWYRTEAQGFMRHSHGVLRGCPHNRPARYQIDAVDAGYNGLGRGGRGGRDDGPRPLSGRTWQQGIQWAKGFLAVESPVPEKLTITVANFNVGSPKWFGPWDSRKEGIKAVVKALSPDVLVCQETHFSYMTADILAALGPDYAHVSSPVGTDLFYRKDKFSQTQPYVEYSMKVQGRVAGVLHLKDRATRKDFTIIGTHAPAKVPSYRTIFERNLCKLVPQVTGARVVVGDLNTTKYSNAPRKGLGSLGFSSERQQAAIANEGSPEFPGKGWLSGIYTKPSEAKITGGQLHLTSPRLSDHRPFVARIEIR